MFQGADVDGLDTLARRTTEAADFADDVVVALRVVVAALKAMSWTGWAAAFAAYLEGVVIPWVQATGRYLRTFAGILAMTSSEQKQVSGDMPQISLPAGSWTSVSYPTQSAVVAPQVTAPEHQISAGPTGGGAGGGGATITAPTVIGQVQAAGGGADGGGGTAVAPGPVGATAGTGQVTAAGGGRGALVDGATTVGDAGSGRSFGGGAVGAGSFGGALAGGAAFGGGGLGGSAATGPGSDPGAAVPVGGGGLDGPTSGQGPSSATADGVRVTELPVRSGTGGLDTAATGDGGTGHRDLPILVEEQGAAPLAAAAPLGLAGVGAAAAGALRSARHTTADDTQAGDPVATSVHDLLPGTSR